MLKSGAQSANSGVPVHLLLRWVIKLVKSVMQTLELLPAIERMADALKKNNKVKGRQGKFGVLRRPPPQRALNSAAQAQIIPL